MTIKCPNFLYILIIYIFFREILIYNININEDQNCQDEQYTDKGKENEFNLSSSQSEENNSQKSTGKFILITYLHVHVYYGCFCDRVKMIQLK